MSSSNIGDTTIGSKIFLGIRISLSWETKLWKVTTIDRPIGMLIIVEMRRQPPPVEVGWGGGGDLDGTSTELRCSHQEAIKTMKFEGGDVMYYVPRTKARVDED